MLSTVFNQGWLQLNAMILHLLSKEQDREFHLSQIFLPVEVRKTN